jgi:predicted DNA-binding transcriptional regulator YafY
VEPYGLVNAERRWYLLARDLDRDDWRTFRLDRVAGPELAGHRFVPIAGVDPASMVLERLAILPYRWQAKVRLDVEVSVAEAEIPRTIGSVEEVDGETMLHIGADEVDWLARYVAGLPFGAEVRDPPELRAALRALGRRLQRVNR